MLINLGGFPIFIHERILENSYSNNEYSFSNRIYSIFEYYSYSVDTLILGLPGKQHNSHGLLDEYKVSKGYRVNRKYH